MATVLPVPHQNALAVRREDAGRVPVLAVRGGLDGDTAPQLSAAVCSFGCEKVVVDLSELDFIDADGARDLVLAARVLAVGLHVVCPAQGPVRRLLEATRATRSLTVHDARTDALSALSRRW